VDSKKPGKFIDQKVFPFLVIVVSAILGIGSRKYGNYLPKFIAAYTGDTMWALAFFAFFRMLFPHKRNWEIALLTFDFSCLIELSQLWHTVWLEKIRSTFFGGLLLGFGFRYSDLFCYFSGSFLGLLIFSLCKSRKRNKTLFGEANCLKK